jgi:hypothetical protein
MTDRVTPGGSPSSVRQTCPKCGTKGVRTLPVGWYPELAYLACHRCQYVWTVERTPELMKALAGDGQPASPASGPRRVFRWISQSLVRVGLRCGVWVLGVRRRVIGWLRKDRHA